MRCLPFRVTLPLRILPVIASCLVLFAFTFCVLWSVTFNFHETTETHCNVTNYLPSISSAVDSFYPQILVWRLSIATHIIPRYLIVCMYYRFYHTVFSVQGWLKYVTSFSICLLFIENSALVGLTFISSTDHFKGHQNSFIIFTFSSVMYVITTLYIWRHPPAKLTRMQIHSCRLKKLTAFSMVLSVIIMGYMYYRHNKYCEPLVYTWFCLAEYCVVFNNIAFHATAYYDFYNLHSSIAGLLRGFTFMPKRQVTGV